MNLKSLKKNDLGYFIGRSHFEEEDSVQNYLVFQPISRYFEIIANKNIHHHGNLKDYRTKLLHLMLPAIIVLLY